MLPMVSLFSYYLVVVTNILAQNVDARQYHQHDRKMFDSFMNVDDDLSLWIDEQQVKIFSGKVQHLFKKWA